MDYIVFDLEWNQCPYGKERENNKLPFEIIEIGAIKLNGQMETVDQFQCLIQPVVYKRLHHRTQEIIGLDMKMLEQGTPFYKAVREFLKWCGEDYRFCTWGTMDLGELQRNMKYYGLLALLPGPVKYYDVQKLFSRSFEDGVSRKSLEYGVNHLHVEKLADFHRALADARYTAEILKRVDGHVRDTYYSIDCYQSPRKRSEEIHAVYDDYTKYISREFPSKEEAMGDREVVSSRCIYCNRRARKKIRWFSINSRNYYCLARCPEHGLLKGKIRMRRNDNDNFYVVKTIKAVGEDGAKQIREKQRMMRLRRRRKRAHEAMGEMKKGL